MNNPIENMISRAVNTLALAYVPYSKYPVASCIYTDNGNFYTGINIENSAYGLTLCAEACAIANMVSAGEQRIKSMVILAENNRLCSPCGACRQRIFEFSNPQTQIYLCNKDTVFHALTVNELLPLAFDFRDYNQTH